MTADDTTRRAEVRDLIANALVWSSPTNHAPNLEALPLHRREQWRTRADAVLDALADAGLLAPTRLREEWAALDDDGSVLWNYGGDSHSPHREYGTSRTFSRHVTDWVPFDRAEGDGRAER